MKSLTSLIVTGAGLIVISATAASAQTPGQRIVIEQPGSPFRQEGLIRIQSNINFFVAGPTGEGDEAQKLRDQARRVVYEMASHECDLLREVLAKDCRLENINVNVNGGRNFGPQQPEGYNVNGAMSFQITLK